MRARSLAALTLYALAAGITVAAAAMPVAAIVGLTVKVASTSNLTLPPVLRAPRSSQTTFVYADDGRTLITAFYDENRREVPLDQIAPVMRQAIVAAEDVRFFQHGGVDLRSVVRALVSDAGSGSIEQGASTLTMQYVRNVLKSDPDLSAREHLDATADTPGRKLQEARYAIALERSLSKEDILDRYLNITYFGAGAYGIDAASRTYFGEPARELTLVQAALLAGIVQAPDADSPIGGDHRAALARRAYVLDAMAGAGDITTAQAAAAKGEPVTLNPHREPNGCAAVPPGHNDWGFFCDELRQWWDAQPQFGATVTQRERALVEGGYTIVTSLDPVVQAATLAQSLSVYGYGSARTLPIAVVAPGTGGVLALAVNRHYSLTPNPPAHPKAPNTVNQLIAGGGGVAGYQAGSTFKLFTMLAALEQGRVLDTGFDAPAAIRTPFPDGDGPGGCGGDWCPANASPSWMDGYRTMWTAFGRSVNTYFVWLEEQVGPRAAVAMAQRLGIVFRAPADAALAAEPDGWGAFTLGVADTTPLDLAEAYATVAAGGRYCAPLPVVSITGADGQRLAAAAPACRQAVDPDVAAAAADAARCPVGQQSAYGRCDGGTAPMVSAVLGGRPAGGKTGSSEGNATETFVGFTTQVAAAGIAVDPDNPHDAVGSAVSGAVDIAVARAMATALAGQPYRDFPVPGRRIAFGDRRYRFDGAAPGGPTSGGPPAGGTAPGSGAPGSGAPGSGAPGSGASPAPTPPPAPTPSTPPRRRRP